MDDAVIDVQVARVVGVDDLRRHGLDDGLDGLDDVQQGQGIEAVVGQAQQARLFRTDHGCCAQGGGLEGGQLRLPSRRVATGIARRGALGDDQHVHRVASGGVPRQGPAAAEDLVIGMRCYHQYSSCRPGGVSRQTDPRRSA